MNTSSTINHANTSRIFFDGTNIQQHHGLRTIPSHSVGPNCYEKNADKRNDASMKRLGEKKKRSSFKKKRVAKQRMPSLCNDMPLSPTMKEIARRQALHEQDKLTLQAAASYLESKLAQIEDDHEETLIQIEESKRREMTRIHREIRVEKILTDQEAEREEESSHHDLEVINETIQTLRDINAIVRRQNQELSDDIDALKIENKRLFDDTARLYCAMEEVQQEIQDAEKQQRELQAAEDFLKNRHREYTNARREADDDIHYEKGEARKCRSKIAQAVREINERCPQRGVADAIHLHTEKIFLEVDSASSE